MTAPLSRPLLLLVAGGLLVAHYDALAAMVGLWSRSPMYSYAFSVPVISAYLLWSRRDAFARLTPAPHRLAGAAVIASGIALLLAGRIASVQVLEQLAFLVSLVGALLVTLGPAYVRTGWAGLAYVLLMVPIWDAFTEPLQEPFQTYSALAGTAILRWIGIPAHREATIIALPNLNIEVARACSGVNYLVAVLALGLPLAYLRLTSNARRLTLLACAVVIAALSNALRVALISTLAYFEIGSALHGPFHVLHGLFVAGIGYVALFVGLRLLAEPAHAAPNGSLAESYPRLRRHAWHPRTVDLVALAVVFWTIGMTVPSAARSGNGGLVAGLESLPMQLGRWVGERLPGAGTEWWNGADEQIYRRYRTLSGASIDLYVGYFASQSQDKEIASYRSAVLHRQASQMALAQGAAEGLHVNVVRGVGGRNVISAFWYEINGSVETSQYAAKLRTGWNALVRGRSDGMVVMLSSTVKQADRESQALEELKEFAGIVHEALASTLVERRQAGGLPAKASLPADPMLRADSSQ